MSSQIRLERPAYFDNLERTQKSDVDITDWLVWFLCCLQRAITGAHGLLGRVLGKAKFWERASTCAQ